MPKEYPVFPGIDMEKTGKKIRKLMDERNLTVQDIQDVFGFNAPQAVYKWLRGDSIPNIDNLWQLAMFMKISPTDIIVCYDFSDSEK